MRLQNLIDIYERESDYVVDWTHTSFYEGALDITNMLSYRSRVEQPSPLPPRVVFVIYWTSVYIVNDNLEGCRRCRSLSGYLWCYLLCGCTA